MKNLSSKLQMGGLVLFVLTSLLLAGCSLLNLIKPNQTENAGPSFTYKVSDFGMTYAEVWFATKDEWNSSLSSMTVVLKNGEEQVDYDFIQDADEIYKLYKGLKPDTSYTVDIEYVLKSYDRIKKSYTFTTKPLQAIDFSVKYDQYYGVVFSTKEKADDLFKQVKLYRAESENGEYSIVNFKHSYNSSTYEDNNGLKSNTKYYYRFEFYTTYDAETPDFTTTSPISCTTEIQLPASVDSQSVKIKTGFTYAEISWEPSLNAEWFEICEASYPYTKIEDFGKIEGTSLLIKNLDPSVQYKYKLFAVNSRGKSEYGTDLIIYTLSPKIKSFTVTADQSSAEYRIESNYEKNDYDDERDVKVEYWIGKDRYKNSDVIAGPSSEPVITRTGLTPQTAYRGTYGDKIPGFVHMKISYKDSEGDQQEKVFDYASGYDYFDYTKDFYTYGFDAVTDLKVTDIKANSATLSFTELSSEQKFGNKIYYAAYAYYDGKEEAYKANNTSSTITLTGLNPGKNYTFKVLAYSGYSVPSSGTLFYAEVEGATDSGLSKPVISSVTESEALIPTSTKLNVSWSKIDEDDGSGNVIYGVEYKIFEKSKFEKKFQHYVDEIPVSDYVNTYEGSMPVNAGNRYIVRVYAYKKEDPACIVYSDAATLQTKEIDDNVIACALTYPDSNDLGLEAGKIVDFTEPKVWSNNAAPQSSLTEGYNMGLTQFMGEPDKEHFRWPSGDVSFFAFKYNFDAAVDADNIPRLIFLDYAAFWPNKESNFGYFDEIYIIIPDEDGHILKTFGAEKSVFEETNMPMFEKGAMGRFVSKTKVSEAGFQIEESWIYNNSVYIGVKQESAGDLGFSYYY